MSDIGENAITWTDVVRLDPTLAGVTEGSQVNIIEDTYVYLSSKNWGNKLNLAAKYLAAHTGSILLRGGGSGPSTAVTLETLGDASRGYAQPFVSTGSWNDLELTVWGKAFKRLARSVLPFAVVAG